MADDLGDEWWKESDDDSNDSSTGIKSGEKTPSKKGLKRPAESEDSEEEADSPDEPLQRVSSKSKRKKPSSTKENVDRKKKKRSKTFVKKKITDVDEDTLRKGGTPADVQLLVRPMVTISKADDSQSKSDDDDDDDERLSFDADFFPANQQQAAGDYLREVIPGWQLAVEKATLSPGSPLLLILCSSAIRAVQLNRELKSFLGKDCKTAKLFAKHMKLEDQKVFLKKKACHVSIGTPNRVQSLLQSGCLKLKQIHAVILDWNWRDIKLKRMVDIPDVRRDLSMLLKEYVVDHIKQTPCRIAIL